MTPGSGGPRVGEGSEAPVYGPQMALCLGTNSANTNADEAFDRGFRFRARPLAE